MPKLNPIVRAPEQLIQLQQLFLQQIQLPDQKIVPIDLPFFNFVCYTIDMFMEYAKSNLGINLNLFLVDYHFRKNNSALDVYRRFMGFIKSWKKYSETDEGRLLLTFLGKERNNKICVKLFLKLRKILLKNINQKILQQISLSHEDAVTIVHTMTIISGQQRKTLTKKINEYFITKNIKYVNNAKFNAAIICEYFMNELKDCKYEQFSTNLSQKIATHSKDLHVEAVEIIDDEPIHLEESSFLSDSFQNAMNTFGANELFKDESRKENISEVLDYDKNKKGLVNLQKCLHELNILKEKDLEIDNRFRKVTNSRL